MNEFEIELAGELLTVKPQSDGSFDVWDGGRILGNLMPKIKDDSSVEWVTNDLIGHDYAQQIGELITEKEI